MKACNKFDTCVINEPVFIVRMVQLSYGAATVATAALQTPHPMGRRFEHHTLRTIVLETTP